MPVNYSAISAGPSTRRNTTDELIVWSVDYKSMTKAELQQVARDNGLSTAGSKADLVARLSA